MVIDILSYQRKILVWSAVTIMAVGFFLPSTAWPEEADENFPGELETEELEAGELEMVDMVGPEEKAEEERERLEKEAKRAREVARKEAFKAKQKAREAKKIELKEKRAGEKWEKIKKNTKSVFVLVHYDQFVVKTLPMKENFFIPQTSLTIDPSSMRNWSHRLSNHFGFGEGESFLLHFETFYYDDKEGVVYPNYVLQLNLEVPQERFKNGQRIPISQLKGYLAWVHPDFPHGNLFLSPKSGHLYLWQIEKGHLMGRLDMKFEHEELTYPIHLYGKVRAYRETKEEYTASQNEIRKDIYSDIAALDQIPVHRDRLRPRYDYKSRKKKSDPWVEGRSSNIWREQRDLKL